MMGDALERFVHLTRTHVGGTIIDIYIISKHDLGIPCARTEPLRAVSRLSAAFSYPQVLRRSSGCMPRALYYTAGTISQNRS